MFDYKECREVRISHLPIGAMSHQTPKACALDASSKSPPIPRVSRSTALIGIHRENDR